MENEQARTFQSLRSVQRFLLEHAELLPRAVRLRQRLDRLLEQFVEHARDQEAARVLARHATARKRLLRRQLVRAHMAPIALIAQEELPHTEELVALRLPKGKPSPAKLDAHARGMAQAAARYAGLLIAAGLPEDFLVRLEEAADAFIAADVHRTEQRGQQAGATRGISKKLRASRRLVRVIDNFVKVGLADRPELLVEWDHARRVEHIATKKGLLLSPGAQRALPAPASYGRKLSGRLLPIFAHVRTFVEGARPSPVALLVEKTESSSMEGEEHNATAP